jgi:formylglycine-generating enzyme required for sulfatase activity
VGDEISRGLRRGWLGHAVLVVCALIVAWSAFPARAVTQAGHIIVGLSALDVFGTTPEVVSVWIDGREAGDSSNQINGISAGRHEVTLKATGYADYKATLTFEAGVPAVLRDIRLRSTMATLEVKMVEPSVAEIVIDGQPQGLTGGVLSGIAPGRRQVVLRAEGYRDQVKEIVLRADRASALSGVRLEALPAQLSVTVNIMGAEVLVDGRRVGRSSGGTDVFEVAPTAERLEVKRDGYVARSERIALKPGGAAAFVVELRRGKGREGSFFCPAGYVRIEPGTFTMGSPASEEGREFDEFQHSVTITHAYCMKATEVTQGEWQAVMGSNPSGFKNCGANCPVEQVSWDDAVLYANALNRREGLPECYAGSTFTGLGCRGYRLPTEAEWEYAARAGTTAATYRNLDGVAWYRDNAGRTTHPVRKKQPNAWGLYDMLGNVWEWTGDWYDTDPGTATDPTGPASGPYRVSRSGSWSNSARYARAASRNFERPDRRDSGLGFRLAKTAPAGSESGNLGRSATMGSSSSGATGGCPAGYVRIAPGTFTMGSPASEEGRFDKESQHSVTITRAYCMKATEVTQGEWQSVMGSNPSKFTSCGANCPVEQVSWDDAVGYANALSRREGLPECYAGSTFSGLSCKGYQLPTEAGWEYAARAGTTGATYGNLDSVSWYRENSGSATHPVGQKQPNAWGLFDMLGNVWEWTGDWYASYAGATSDPAGAPAGSNRVLRGGSWYNTARYARAAFRDYDTPDYRYGSLGFRLVRTAE